MKTHSTNFTKEQPKGLKGWLMLVGIGLVLAVVLILSYLVLIYTQIFLSLAWAIFTTPESDSYNQYFAPLVIGEVVFNALLLLAVIYTNYLYFTSKRGFPQWFSGILISFVLYIVIDSILISTVMLDTQAFSTKTLTSIAGALLIATIWVPYMRSSKRVKNTFVN